LFSAVNGILHQEVLLINDEFFLRNVFFAGLYWKDAIIKEIVDGVPNKVQ
jgi:hypothetical protein